MVGLPEKKRCSKCGIVQSFEDDFQDDKRATDGKKCWCRTCCNENTLENQKRRLAEPMDPIAEATRQRYAKRFRVIREAGLSMDEEGVIPKIDRLLKRHGLEKEMRRP